VKERKKLFYKNKVITCVQIILKMKNQYIGLRYFLENSQSRYIGSKILKY